MTRAKEQAVRDAAGVLLTAIHDARDAGLVIQWPNRPEDLAFIAVSEGKNAGVTVTVSAPAEVPVETVGKASAAAQKAADRVAGAPK